MLEAHLKTGLATPSVAVINDNFATIHIFLKAVNGDWSSWSTYGACSKSCGGGTKTRSRWNHQTLQTSIGFPGSSLITRSCTSPTPYCGGKNCAGSTSEDTSCNTQCCGNQCKFCHNPSFLLFKAVNGDWTSWSTYGVCSKSCGGGTKTRSRWNHQLLQTSFGFPSSSLIIRSCTSPTPSCGGKTCAGSTSEDISCNTQCCGNQILILPQYIFFS